MAGPIRKTGPLTAIGTMSGTSLDGVDAAVLVTDGREIIEFGASRYHPYSTTDRKVLRAALGEWQGPVVDAARDVVEQAHLAVLQWMERADLVGFHGQTLAHEPRGRGTLQVGDGAWLADALGMPVVWDFRTADVDLGGEGAPLAPFFHFACAKHVGAEAPLAFLNLGGVGNLTYVDPGFEHPDAPGALLAFDTGPANAPINDLMLARRGVPFDKDGFVARQGQVDEGLLAQFMAEPYFARVPPKSLDRNDFCETGRMVDGLSDPDAVATLTGMSAAAVVRGMDHCPKAPAQVLVTGGGRRNPVLMDMLSAALDCPVVPIEDVGLDGDMLEAQAFAFLAVRVARGLPTSCPGTTGVRAAVGGGIVSQPGSATARVSRA